MPGKAMLMAKGTGSPLDNVDLDNLVAPVQRDGSRLQSLRSEIQSHLLLAVKS